MTMLFLWGLETATTSCPEETTPEAYTEEDIKEEPWDNEIRAHPVREEGKELRNQERLVT